MPGTLARIPGGGGLPGGSQGGEGADADAEHMAIFHGEEVPEEFARYWRTISFPDDVSPHTEARDEYGNPVEEEDEPGFWPDEAEAWPRNVEKDEHVSRALAVEGGKKLLNFIKANPHAFRNMPGMAGVVYANVEAAMWAAMTCNNPVGQTQPTMERYMREPTMERYMREPTMERYMRAQEDDHGP